MRPHIQALLFAATCSTAIVFTPLTPLEAQTSPDSAPSLVLQQAQAVQSIDNFEVAHQVDITTDDGHYKRTTHSYLKTWVQRPGHIRIESQQATRSETLVSDGVQTTIYNGANRTPSSQSGAAPAGLFSSAFPSLARQLSGSNLPNVMTSAKLAGMEELQVKDKSFPCDVVEVHVQPGASDGALANNTIRLWISREFKVPLKVQAIFLGAGSAPRQEYSDYVTQFKPRIRISPSTWLMETRARPQN